MKHRHLALLFLLALPLPASAQQTPLGSATAPAHTHAVVSAVTPEVADLRRDLERIIAAPGWRGNEYGVLVVSLDRGDTLFALNPDLPLAPASNTKLFSTAAALYYLGPDFHYTTYLLADGPIHDGVLDGDLILYGTGDPTLSKRMLDENVDVLQAMVDSLVLFGIREIRGDVVGDGSYFDAEWTGPDWQENDLDAWYGAPVGALSYAENVVAIRFRPSSPGRPATISTSPTTQGLALENRVTTVSSGRPGVTFERRDGRLVAIGRVVSGTAGIARSIPVVDPANYAAARLRALIEERRIPVGGEVRAVYDPAQSRVGFTARARRLTAAPRVLAAHQSPPLAEIVSVTNHVSHNLFAEALLKTVGRIVTGDGSYASGALAVQRFLHRELGPEPLSISQIDGSGLSRNNLLTARTTVRLLDYMADCDVWESYFASLPVAAVNAGLEHRMRRTAAAANLRAKTGTIRRVSALSGYVLSADGERLAFSILANGVPSTARAKRSEDAIGARLAAFSRGAETVAAEAGAWGTASSDTESE